MANLRHWAQQGDEFHMGMQSLRIRPQGGPLPSVEFGSHFDRLLKLEAPASLANALEAWHREVQAFGAEFVKRLEGQPHEPLGQYADIDDAALVVSAFCERRTNIDPQPIHDLIFDFDKLADQSPGAARQLLRRVSAIHDRLQNFLYGLPKSDTAEIKSTENHDRDRRLYEIHLDKSLRWPQIVDKFNSENPDNEIVDGDQARKAVNRFIKKDPENRALQKRQSTGRPRRKSDK